MKMGLTGVRSQEDEFLGLVDALFVSLEAGERLDISWAGERTDFVRFNGAKVRQAGSVSQRELTLRLIVGRRHVAARLQPGGQRSVDLAGARGALEDLRGRLSCLPEDPHLLLVDDAPAVRRLRPGRIPDGPTMVHDVLEAAGQPAPDLVGILGAGELYRGFASSAGVRHWFQDTGFSLDFCLVAEADRAVKRSWSGDTWDRAALARLMTDARADLALLQLPVCRVDPGQYRAWLSPSAVASVLALAGWSGFSARAQRAQTSCLQGLVDGRQSLSPKVHLWESAALGLAPPFQSQGFARPDRIALISGGKHVGALTSPRSSLEHGLVTNGAEPEESPHALEMAPGELAAQSARAALGTGIWLSNLWYLNHSDPSSGRMTGMSRFASFWVEDGEVVGPLAVMRFDDTLYRMFGSELIDLSDTAERVPDVHTYFRRSLRGCQVPGALLRTLRFTL